MMAERSELEELYARAQAALEAKDSDRARALLKQIVLADEGYRDASRLLAGLVERGRRSWYRGARLWILPGAIGALALLALFVAGMAGRTFPSPGSIQGAATQPGQPEPGTAARTDEARSEVALGELSYAWKRIYPGEGFLRDTLRAIAIHPKDPEVLFVGAENAGIYETIDGGISWHPAFSNLGQGGITSLAIDSEDPNVLYAGVSSGALFRTIDRGGSWEKVQDGTAPNLIVMDPQGSRHLYFVSGTDIFESTDGGDTWEQVSTGEQANFRISDMVVVPEGAGSTLYAYGVLYNAGGETRGVYRSTDAGRTWEPDGGDVGAILTGDEEGVLALGDGGQIYRRISEGEWQPVLRVNVDAVEFAISAANSRRVYLLRDGVWFSEDAGETWSERSNGLGTARLDLVMHPTDSSVLYGETGDMYGDCALYRSPDQGRTWLRISGAERFGCSLALDAGGQVVYRTLGRSEDGGLTWTPLGLPGQGRYVAAHPAIPGTVYAALWDNPLAASSDFGATWGIVGTMRNDVEARLSFGNDGRLYAFGYPQGQRSNDLGRTWEDCAPFEGNVLPSRAASRALVDPNDSSKVLVATRGAGIQSSDDGCLSWEARNDGMDSLLASTLARDPVHPDVLYAGTDGGAYVSFDGGEKWIEINDGLLGATVIYSIVVDPQSKAYAATPYGIFKLEAK